MEQDNITFHIKIPTRDLALTSHLLNSIIEKKNVLPVLNNIKMEAFNNKVKLVATDMDISICEYLDAQVLTSGRLTVNSRTLTDIIKKFPTDIVELEYKDNELKIKGDYCEFSILVDSAVAFPNVDEAEAFEEGTVIKSENLAKIIEHTMFSISTEETRYNLCGIYLHLLDNLIAAASIDGHRMSVSRHQAENINKFENAIIPRKTVDKLYEILRDRAKDIDITIAFKPNKVIFHYGQITITTKVIDGSFPDYKEFVPQKSSKVLTVSVKSFSDAIERISIITAEKFKAIKMSLSRDKVEISAFGESKGSGREVLTDAKYDGDEMQVGFNPRYVLDVLKVISKGEVNVYFNDASSPILIKDPEFENADFVVMPIKV